MAKLQSESDIKYQLQLPTVSYRVITDDKSLLTPAGVHSEQSRSYGYNDFSDFERPEYYIRYIEPIESELAIQVEYDMDEQDQEWLDAVNAERKKDQSGPVSYEAFEIIIDKLEKEWFNLIKRIPQPASHLPVEDSKCAICDDGEGENANAIVFCDGCNLAVHQDCYGVPYIPEGQWLCRKCTVSPENPVSCLFCPNEGGAFKQTTTGHWCHLLCAIGIPELTVANPTYMEPIQDMDHMPKSRWKLVCSLCRERVGACIQCDNRSCFTAFHVTCAAQAGLLTPMKAVGQDGYIRAFCDKHLPPHMRREVDLDEGSDYSEAPVPRKRKRSGTQPPNTTVTSKSARAHTKSYRPEAPIVPRMIVNLLEAYVAKIAIRKRHPFIERVCRYWSLKREARRGAPLLKRLHLEPWTASSVTRQQSEAEKASKLKFLTMLRNDLDKVRMLTELSRKREREKLRQTQAIKDLVDKFLFPHYAKLRLVLEKITAMDRQELFTHPVNRVEVPDYYEIIKEPMCWLAIDEKLEKNGYRNMADFKRDVLLVLDNAMTYNRPDHVYHKTAKRIKTNSQDLLNDLDKLTEQSRLANAGEVVSHGREDIVGDLEPSQVLLSALLHPVQDEPDQDYLASLFAFQLEKPRPPTPTPPPPPSPKKLPKKKTWAERKKQMEDRAAEHRARLEASGSTTTRAGRAMAKAFAEEAGLPASSDVSSPALPQQDGSRSTRAGRRPARSEPDAAVVPAKKPISESTSSTGRRREQIGVAGFETVVRLSDKERRAQESQLDLITEEVGNQDSFKRFNVGWVLPEGSKRRRVEKSESSHPPISKPKTVKAGRLSGTPATIREDLEPDIVAGPSRATPRSPETGTRPQDTSGSLTPVSRRDSSLTPVSNVPTPVSARGKKGSRATRAQALNPEDAGAPEDEAQTAATSHPATTSDEGTARARKRGRTSTIRRGKGKGRASGGGAGQHVGQTTTADDMKTEAVGKGTIDRDVESNGKVGDSEMTPLSDDEAGGEPEAADADMGMEVEGDEIVVLPSAEQPEQEGEGEVTSPTTPTATDTPALTPTPTRKSRKPAKGKAKASRRSSARHRGQAEVPDEDEAGEEQEETLEVKETEAEEIEEQEEKEKENNADDGEEANDGEDDPYRPGTLVWAKLTGYPYFPAEVIDYKLHHDDLPATVLQSEATARRQHKGAPIWLVRFYDHTTSYGWVPEGKMDPLGVDDDVDAMYLAGKERGRHKGFKSSSVSKTVRQGYRSALAAIDSQGEEGEEAEAGDA